MKKEDFNKSLSKLYKQAYTQNLLEIALKIKQLQANIMGFLVPKSRKIPKLTELTDSEINEFLKECEDPSLKNKDQEILSW